MTFLYKYKNQVTSKIEVNFDKQEVRVTNYTNDMLHRAFGINETPTFSEFETFLEDRCFPRSRDNMKMHLQALGLNFYEPLLIVMKTKGRLEGDFMSLEIVEEKG